MNAAAENERQYELPGAEGKPAAPIAAARGRVPAYEEKLERRDQCGFGT
ncbi:MAG TPA: hypothetical protein VIU64_02110 [Polyangia bacterium]